MEMMTSRLHGMLALAAFLFITMVSAQTVTSAVNNNSTASICEDTKPNDFCERLKKFGWCNTRRPSMKETCSKTCGYCVDVCENKMKMKCRKWVYFGACVTHPKFMKYNCRRMCGFCQGRNEKRSKPSCTQTYFGCCWDKNPAKGFNQKGCKKCKDNLRLCPIFYEDCVAGFNVNFMHTFCAKTCRLCNKDGYLPVYAS